MNMPPHMTEWRVFADGNLWRLNKESGFIEHIECTHYSDEAYIQVHRTPGYPRTVERICEKKYHDAIEMTCESLKGKLDKDLMRRLIVMTIATESRGINGPEGRREEPGYKSEDETPKKISGGVMHTLLSTAREALGNPELGFEELYKPEISILAGALYIIDTKHHHNFDPVLTLATYNAGEPKYSTRNDWRLVCTQWPGSSKTHIDWGLSFYNDFVEWQNIQKGM